MKRSPLLVAAALGMLAACTPSTPPAEPQTMASATSVPETAPAAVEMQAPAGKYEADLDHSTLSFSVGHMGLSNYIARFTEYAVVVNLHPEAMATSSVAVTIDPTSVAMDFYSDYQALHPKSKFESWPEDLAQSAHFFNAGQYPQVEFHSTSVEQTGAGTFTIVGDLALLGQSHPVTLHATLVGSSATHPAYGDRGAFGFSATGSFKRSDFGMDFMLKPPMLGDLVTVRFEGEFLQVVPPAPATTLAN